MRRIYNTVKFRRLGGWVWQLASLQFAYNYEQLPLPQNNMFSQMLAVSSSSCTVLEVQASAAASNRADLVRDALSSAERVADGTLILVFAEHL